MLPIKPWHTPWFQRCWNVKKGFILKSMNHSIHTGAHARTRTHTHHTRPWIPLSKGRKTVIKNQFSKQARFVPPLKRRMWGIWTLFYGIHLLPEDNSEQHWQLMDHISYLRDVLFLKLKAEKVIRFAFTLATEWQGNFHHTYSFFFSSFSIFLFSLTFAFILALSFFFFYLKSSLGVSISH